MDAPALLGRLLEDEPFWRHSGGGVTLTGGEPTSAMDLVSELAAHLHGLGVHVLLQTCGHFSWEIFEAKLLPHLDAIAFDLKLADPETHRRYTGVGNATILANFQRLAARSSPELVARTPLVPEITDTARNLNALQAIIATAGVRRHLLLPFNHPPTPEVPPCRSTSITP